MGDSPEYIKHNTNNRDLSDLPESLHYVIENSALELNIHISIRFIISIRSTSYQMTLTFTSTALHPLAMSDGEGS